MKANILNSQKLCLKCLDDTGDQELRMFTLYAKADGLYVLDDEGNDRCVALITATKPTVVPTDLAKTLEKLVPKAEYDGKLDRVAEECYDAITWKDKRPKPPYSVVLDTLDRDMRSKLRDSIDARTNAIIEAGFCYQGIKFNLDLRHQLLYHNLWEMRSRLEFPVTVKGVGDAYLELKTQADLQDFIFAGLTHIQTSMQAGWSLKSALATKAYPFRTYSDLLTWEDIR